MRRYSEYIQLVNEKQRLSEKILELERQVVDRIAHRTAHQPFLPTVSTAFLQDSGRIKIKAALIHGLDPFGTNMKLVLISHVFPSDQVDPVWIRSALWYHS